MPDYFAKGALRVSAMLFVVSAVSFGQVAFTEYNLPTARSGPFNIVSGADGALWFTEGYTNKIARITTSGSITEFSIPLESITSGLGAITAGPDGAVWFLEVGFFYVSEIGRITTGGSVSVFPFPSPNTNPVGITSGPDGALWLTDGPNIWRVTTAGSFTKFPLPYPLTSDAITSGPDGALWFTDWSDKIGRLATNGSISEYPIPTVSSKPAAITAGPDGALWFVESGMGKIGRITTTGSITEFATSNAPGQAFWITSGPDGALWFTEPFRNKIGRITTTGSITEYPVPTLVSAPDQITAGPDGALWFTEFLGNKIGRLALSPLYKPFSSQIGVVRPLGAGPDTSMAFYLDANGDNIWDAGDKVEYFGVTGIPGVTLNDVPVAGDWDGTGVMRIGVFHCPVVSLGPCTWFIDLNNNGQWDGEFGGDRVWANFGLAGDIPVVGDWTGDGKSKIGVIRCTPGSTNPCVWYLDMGNRHTYDPATVGILFLGQAGDLPAVGSWLPNPISPAVEIGVVHCPTIGGACTWTVDSAGMTAHANPTPIDVRPSATTAGAFTALGGFQPGDVPVMGNWSGTGTLRMGFFRSSFGLWFVDTNGNGVFDPGADQAFIFGLPAIGNPGGVADQPIMGFWTMP